MKDEIKEILDYCKKYIENKDENRITSLLDIYLEKLLDYITNLQEENERLKEELVKIPRAKMEYDLELQDYKSRCEKAIEYIEKNYYTIDIGDVVKKDLLNILGGKNEQ